MTNTIFAIILFILSISMFGETVRIGHTNDKSGTPFQSDVPWLAGSIVLLAFSFILFFHN